MVEFVHVPHEFGDSIIPETQTRLQDPFLLFYPVKGFPGGCKLSLVFSSSAWSLATSLEEESSWRATAGVLGFEAKTIVKTTGGGRDPCPVIEPTGANATSLEEVVVEKECRDPHLVIKPAGANATKGKEEETEVV